MRTWAGIFFASLALSAVSSACKDKSAEKPAKREPTPADDGLEPADIRSVYPMDTKPDPMAEKFCAALHTLPKERHAKCCGETVGVVVTGECVRMMSAAIQSKAVAVDPKSVDLCVEAMKKSLEGCAWVGIWPPLLPRECLHVVEGRLDEGSRCKSALECRSGLRCAGLDPVRAGRCAKPGADRDQCGGTTDPLAVYTEQREYESDHPVCEGFCDRSLCAKASKAGEACKNNFACGRGRHCSGGKCAEGAGAKVGEVCEGSSCEYGARCVKGQCVLPKGQGEKCSEDGECLGGCEAGVCRPTCELVVGGIKHVRHAPTSSAGKAVP